MELAGVQAQYAGVHSTLLHLALDVAHELPPLLRQAQAPCWVGGVSSASIVPVPQRHGMDTCAQQQQAVGSCTRGCNGGAKLSMHPPL